MMTCCKKEKEVECEIKYNQIPRFRFRSQRKRKYNIKKPRSFLFYRKNKKEISGFREELGYDKTFK